MTEPNDLLEHALRYATLGWHVLPLHSWTGDACTCGGNVDPATKAHQPCGSPAKHPRTKSGLNDATDDPAKIRRWWKQWPTANVGLRTGQGFDVLDIDGDVGEQSITEFNEATGTDIPGSSPVSMTGGGGMHVFYAPTGGGNRARMLDKVDWRGKGGYIVAPPSLHASGNRYVWTTEPQPGVALEPAPEPLALLVNPPRVERPGGDVIPLPAPPEGGGTPYGLRALEGELEELGRAPEGMRNHELNRVTYNLYQLVAGNELDGTTVEGQIRQVAANIGLGGHEIEQTIASARSAGMQQPRVAPVLRMVGNLAMEPEAPPWPDDTTDERPPSFLERIHAATYIGDAIKDIPPPTPLIDGWIDLDTIAVMYGPSGAKKSFLAIDWALCVATGAAWFRSNVVQGTVIYVVAEGASGIGIRVQAWEIDRKIYTAGDIHWVTIPINLFTPDWTAAFVEYVTGLQPSLVIFDTLARSMVGGDENLARDVGIVIDNAEKVRRACHACVLIVHHSGKDEANGARGSSALKAAMNTEIEVKAADDVIYVKATKQKDSATDGDLRLEFAQVADSGVLRMYRGGGAGMPDGALVLLADLIAVVDEDGASASTWKASTEVAQRSFYRWVKQLVEQGLVAKHGHRTAARYIPTQLGIEAIERSDEGDV